MQKIGYRVCAFVFALLIISLFLAGNLASSAASETSGNADVQSSSGTVNILLARHGSLVAVTDSMLTLRSGSQTSHESTGVKLYKLDDRTICTMAGLYTQSGPDTHPGLSERLAASFPKIIGDFLKNGPRSFRERKTTFEKKVELLLDRIQFQLTSNIQALASSGPLDLRTISFLEVTVAGYDTDGSLKLAEITLEAHRSEHGVEFTSIERPRGKFLPLCELTASVHPSTVDSGRQYGVQPTIKTVGDDFFCEVAGLTDVAEQNLNKPYMNQSPAIVAYAQAKRFGSNLSLNQIEALATELERLTAEDEKRNKQLRVGGHVQIAILTDGKVIFNEPTPAPFSDTTGSDLASNHEDIVQDCHGMDFVAHPSNGDFRMELAHCNVSIDGMIIHDSTLTNDNIIYEGKGALLFDSNNKVSGSELIIRKTVELQRQDVITLMCKFPWKKVYLDDTVLAPKCTQR